jgi:hypothetical protein
MQGAPSFDFVEEDTVFCDQGGVREEPLGKGGLDVPDGFPVGGTEVSAECKANVEEQVVCQDVREGPGNIGMMFYLMEVQFDVIGMEDNVISGVRDP